MQFRTELHIPPAPFKIGLQSKVLTLGSCFAEVMGEQLLAHKINARVNPFGTLFSPLAICKALGLALGSQPLDERLFVRTSDDLYVHYDFHSSLRATSPQALGVVLNREFDQTARWLAEADVLMLTFGTAFAYRLLAPPTYVANCHKQPQTLFERDLLSVKEVCRAFGDTYRLLKNHNPSLRIILTLSPVRHTNDGLSANAVSKAILRAACHYLETDFQDVVYFPSYELLLDDLRDYRFYKADMIHPNDLAEAYIFEKFAAAYFEPSLSKFVQEWQGIRKALQHRPFNTASVAHQRFLRSTLAKLKALADHVDVQDEIAQVESQIC